jgi:hypothetical protein
MDEKIENAIRKDNRATLTRAAPTGFRVLADNGALPGQSMRPVHEKAGIEALSKVGILISGAHK